MNPIHIISYHSFNQIEYTNYARKGVAQAQTSKLCTRSELSHPYPGPGHPVRDGEYQLNYIYLNDNSNDDARGYKLQNMHYYRISIRVSARNQTML